MTLSILKSSVLTSRESIVALTADIKLTGKALDLNIQIALCSAAAHAHQHGDVSLMNAVIGAMNAGSRSNAARDFLIRFAPCRWNAKKKELMYNKDSLVVDFMDSTQCETMLAKEWVSFRPEPEYKPFDFAKSIESLLKKSTGKLSELIAGDNVDETEVEMLLELSNKLAEHRAAKKALLDAATEEAILMAEIEAEQAAA